MVWSPRKPVWRAVLFVATSVSVAACTNDDPSASTTTASVVVDVATPVTPLATPATTPATAAEATSTTTEPIAPTTTAAETSTTTLPPTSTTSTTSTTTTTTTTVPVAVQELQLRGDGLGSARFGANPDDVIDYVTSILGGNTGDTGWVDPYTFAVCEGTVARRVDWGVLSLLFSDLSDFASGRRHFMGYEYGRVGEIGDEPVGLRTPGGTSLGSRIVDLLADFPEAVVNEGEDGIDIPPNFYVSNNFYGLITGVDPEDRVTVIFGGYGCGA